jgi:hypothetical protein
VVLVEGSDQATAAMSVNAALVRAGVGVARLEPEMLTLEDRFFALTGAAGSDTRDEAA